MPAAPRRRLAWSHDVRLGRRITLPAAPQAAALLILALVNAWFLVWSLDEIQQAGFAQTDWLILRDGAASAHPYLDSLYRWSPLLLGPLTLLTSLPFGAWVALHLLAAIALPTWPLRVIALISWPFWQDVSTGNVMIFIVLAGAWAVRGNRFCQVLFLVLALLVPRPLMVPVVVWLLWKQPWLRTTTMWLVLLIAGLTVVLDSRWSDWIGVLITSGSDIDNPYNIGPSAWVGVLWVPIGLVLAAWLTMVGRVGLASVAASPYLLPYYLLMLLLDMDPPREPGSHSQSAMARTP